MKFDIYFSGLPCEVVIGVITDNKSHYQNLHAHVQGSEFFFCTFNFVDIALLTKCEVKMDGYWPIFLT